MSTPANTTETSGNAQGQKPATCQFGPAAIGFWIARNQELQDKLKEEAKKQAAQDQKDERSIYRNKVKAAWSALADEERSRWEWAYGTFGEVEKKRQLPQPAMDTKQRKLEWSAGKGTTGDGNQSGASPGEEVTPENMPKSALMGPPEGGSTAKNVEAACGLGGGMEQEPGMCEACGFVGCEGKHGGGIYQTQWFCKGCWMAWNSEVASPGQATVTLPLPSQQGWMANDGSASAFPGLMRARGGMPISVVDSSFTRKIPVRLDGGRIDDDYVHGLMKTHAHVKFEKYLYSSSGQPQGLQYKSMDRSGTINVYIPKGTVHITGSPKTNVREEMLNCVSKFSVPNL